jgi:FKBP-type peptidyl-prolyl cis-trans isomerase (trigger factor)
VKIEIGKTDGTRRIITLSAEASEVAAMRRRAIDEVRKLAKIPGFRPGKAPDVLILQRQKDVVDRKFRSILREQALRHVNFFHGGGNILAIVDVEIPEVAIDEALVISIAIDVSPEFELPDYNHIPLPTLVEPEVSNWEIDEQLREVGNDKDVKKLQENARAEIYRQKMFERIKKCQDAILEFLCASVDFPLPESIVRANAIALLEQNIRKMDMHISDEAELEEALNLYISEARRSLKVDFILEAIAKKEAITITSNDLVVYLFTQAGVSDVSPEVLLRKIKKDEKLLRKVHKDCLAYKVIITLLERNSHQKTPIPTPDDASFPAEEEESISMLVPKQKLRRSDDTTSKFARPCLDSCDCREARNESRLSCTPNVSPADSSDESNDVSAAKQF